MYGQGADNPKMYPPPEQHEMYPPHHLVHGGHAEPPLMTSEPQGYGKYSKEAKEERKRIERITYFMFAYNLCIFVSIKTFFGGGERRRGQGVVCPYCNMVTII